MWLGRIYHAGGGECKGGGGGCGLGLFEFSFEWDFGYMIPDVFFFLKKKLWLLTNRCIA